jgi:hypothetical protein
MRESLPRRGLGLGPCGMGLARGRGWGRGRYFYRNEARWADEPSRLRLLEEEERLLKERLGAVRRELEELKK